MNEWKEFAKEKPKDNSPVWIFDNRCIIKVSLLYHYNQHESYTFTHWRPATIPDPPIIKEPWEVAYEKADKEKDKGRGPISAMSFKLGFNAGRDSK